MLPCLLCHVDTSLSCFPATQSNLVLSSERIHKRESGALLNSNSVIHKNASSAKTITLLAMRLYLSQDLPGT